MRTNQKLGVFPPSQVLRADGLISADEVTQLEEEQVNTGERMIDIVLDQGLCTEYDIAKAMVRHLNLPYVPPGSYKLPDSVKELFPREILHRFRVAPLDRFGDLVVFATCGEINQALIEELSAAGQVQIAFVIGQRSDVQTLLDQEFPVEVENEETLGNQLANRFDELFGS